MVPDGVINDKDTIYFIKNSKNARESCRVLIFELSTIDAKMAISFPSFVYYAFEFLIKNFLFLVIIYKYL